MSPNFENRKINILEAPIVKGQGIYKEGNFEQYADCIWSDLEAGYISLQAYGLWMYVNKLAGSNREAYPTQEYLRKKFDVTTKTIGRWTTELETTGWLVKQNRSGTSNKYWISIPAEFDAIDDKKYSARLSTVGQELHQGKRSTKAKKDTLRDTDVSIHKVMDDPMDSSNSVVRDIDVSMDRDIDVSMDRDIDVSLKRQSIKETEFKDTKLLHVPQTLEEPEELDGTSCLADKIPSSVSGDLKDAPSALGILESLDFFGKEDSVTDSNFSGESNNGTSCLDSYTETDSEREEKMPLLGNLDTNEISIGKTLIESSTHTSNSSIRTWKEEADLARQKQNQKILETIAQQKALKEAQEARQEAFRASLAELHPELTEASQTAVQSLQDIPSVSRLDKYAGLRAS